MSYFGSHKLGLFKENISGKSGYFFCQTNKKEELSAPNGRFIMNVLISVNSEE